MFINLSTSKTIMKKTGLVQLHLLVYKDKPREEPIPEKEPMPGREPMPGDEPNPGSEPTPPIEPVPGDPLPRREPLIVGYP